MPPSTVRVEKQQTLTGHRNSVYALLAAADGDHVFSADGGGLLVRWNIKETNPGRLVARFPGSVYALAQVPASGHLLVGQNFEGVHEIDWREKKEVRSIKISGTAVFDLLVVGEHLWVAAGNGELVVVNLSSWTIANRVRLSSHSARTLAFHPHRQELVVGYSDHFVRVLDVATAAVKYEWKAHANSVFTAVYAPDFSYLLTGGRDARLRAWNVNRGYTPGEEVVAHLFAINHIAFSPDGQYFVTCSLDKSIKVWSAEEARLIKVIDKSRHAGHGTSVNKLLWLPSTQQVVSASDDATVSVWNLYIDPPTPTSRNP